MKTYYQFLGIDEDADEEEIRAAYRKCMLRIHPDLHPDDTDAQELAQRLNAAFQTLVDDEAREKYDESLQRQRDLETQHAADSTENPREVAGESEAATAFRGRPQNSGKKKNAAKSTKKGEQQKEAAKRKFRTKRKSFERSLAARIFSKVIPVVFGLGAAGVIILVLWMMANGTHPLDLLSPQKTALRPDELVVELGEQDGETDASDSDVASVASEADSTQEGSVPADEVPPDEVPPDEVSADELSADDMIANDMIASDAMKTAASEVIGTGAGVSDISSALELEDEPEGVAKVEPIDQGPIGISNPSTDATLIAAGTISDDDAQLAVDRLAPEAERHPKPTDRERSEAPKAGRDALQRPLSRSEVA